MIEVGETLGSFLPTLTLHYDKEWIVKFYSDYMKMNTVFQEFKYINSSSLCLNGLFPSTNPSHCDECKIIFEEDFEGLALLETWKEESSPIECQFHPLFVPHILEALFGYLGPEGLQNCRLVCQQWNEEVKQTAANQYPICLTGKYHITSFLKLMIDDENVRFPSRHLKFRNHLATDKETTILFKSIRHLVKTLVLENIGIHYPSFLQFPSCCPSLELLTLKFSMHKFLTCSNRILPKILPLAGSFCSLKHLLLDISWSSFCGTLFEHAPSFSIRFEKIVNLFAEIVELFLDSAPKLITLGLRDAGRDVTDSISTQLFERPSVLKQLENLQIEVYETSMKRWVGLDINLKTLHISRLDHTVSTETLSSILQATSATLIKLIIEYKSPDNESFKLYFPCEMTSLKYLVVSEDFYTIHGGAFSLLKRLPNLRLLHFSSDKTLLWMKYKPQFWQDLFHDENGTLGGVINKHLIRFVSDVYVIDIEVFYKITTAFPGLRALELEIDGALLSRVIQGLKHFHLEEFSIVYFETNGEVLAFDSALTGISEEDCHELLVNEDFRNQTYLQDMKVQTSLADLKYLRTLKISYKMQKPMLATLDWVAISQGILLATSVNHIVLKHFKTSERLVLKMLNKLRLNTFIFTPGKIHLLRKDGLNWIKKRFSSVTFDFGPDNCSEDEIYCN